MCSFICINTTCPGTDSSSSTESLVAIYTPANQRQPSCGTTIPIVFKCHKVLRLELSVLGREGFYFMSSVSDKKGDTQKNRAHNHNRHLVVIYAAPLFIIPTNLFFFSRPV